MSYILGVKELEGVIAPLRSAKELRQMSRDMKQTAH